MKFHTSLLLQLSSFLIVTNINYIISFKPNNIKNIPSIQSNKNSTTPTNHIKKALGITALSTILLNKLAIAGPSPYTPPLNSLNDKVIVITGGNTGLGLESAKRLATAGATILITSRNITKGAKAVQEIKEYCHCDTIYMLQLDLCNISSVKNFVAAYKESPMGGGKIDVLLNNAGVMALPKHTFTSDGYEVTFQSNHLGHFALTGLLLPLLNKSSNQGRIINVSSMAYMIPYKGLDMGNLNGEKSYTPWMAYGQSKLENILFTKELQRRLDAANVTIQVATLHPGAVRTDLPRYIVGENKFESMKSNKLDLRLLFGLYFTKSVVRGASTQIWLASGGGNDVGGKFYFNKKEVTLFSNALDMEKAKELWERSEEMSGVTYRI